MWNRRICLLVGIAFTAAGQQSSDDPLARGLQSFSEGRFAEAESSLRQAVAAQPRLFDARLVLGATLVQLKHTREAIEQLEAARRLKPDHADALKLLAAQYMIEHDYHKAIRLLAPLSSANQSADQEVYLLLIESHQASGDTANSFALAQEAVRRFPSSPQVNCWMGFQLQFAGRYEAARGYLERAIQLAPEYPPTYYVLGDVLLKEHKFQESVGRFQKAVELSPDDADARIGLAQAWAGAGDLAKALEILQNAAKISPEDARVHLQLSRLYFRMGDETRARQEADLSLQLRSRKSGLDELPSALRSAH